jgi:hypothetical protein
MIVTGRRERYQMNSAPASSPATSAAAIITPVSPKAPTATSIMLSSGVGGLRSSTIVTVGIGPSGTRGCCSSTASV